MYEFETVLYKKTSTGKIQTWKIWVVDSTMYSESGQLDGKKILTTDVITTGKNIGKSNETTPCEQALLEAHSRWEAKLKKGYVTKLGDAKTGKVDKIIEGGYNPTLAHSFDKHGDKIVFPCAAQPKLDGIRSTSLEDSLWSRTRKPIISVPHINKAIKSFTNGIPLDGELYNHAFRNDFEKITHIVGQKKQVEVDHEKVEYHIYDAPLEMPYIERYKALLKMFEKIPKNSPLKLVKTLIVNNEAELFEATQTFIAQGYEGSIVRNLNAPYEYKRSYHLQKIKEFEDAEFKITGVEEGRGKLAGHCGAFVCVNKQGTEFKAKMTGELSRLKVYWDNQKDYIGKQLTVKFQGLTGKNGVPRFPVGLRIRGDL